MSEINAPAASITSLSMGTEVPEWLMTLEPHPQNPHSTRGHFRFAVDVDVVDGPDCFIVVPRAVGAYGSVVDMSGTQGCIMFAASKPVHISTAYQVIMPMEVNAWHENVGPGLAQMRPHSPDTEAFLAGNPNPYELPDGHRTDLVSMMPAPDGCGLTPRHVFKSKPSLLRRLWWAVAGH